MPEYTKKEIKEIFQKPEKELKINKAVFILQKRIKELEEKVATLESTTYLLEIDTKNNS